MPLLLLVDTTHINPTNHNTYHTTTSTPSSYVGGSIKLAYYFHSFDTNYIIFRNVEMPEKENSN
jgi:hypothetical protein